MNSLIEHSIYGNESVWKNLLNDFKENRLAHAYLFSGIKGIGKALTAKYFIKTIIDADSILGKRIDEGNFLDLLYIKKEDKSEITIDAIRKADDFFNQTAAEKIQKFVIIDAVEDLNLNAANALLKILEEPKPNTYIFLISHAHHKVLRTIRSRCRLIKFSPLNKEQMREICDIDKYKELENFIAGSPGIVKICDEVLALEIYHKLLNLIEDDNIIEFNKFSDNIIKNHLSFQITQDLIIFISSMLKKVEAYDNLLKMFQDCEIYNLDKKQILLQALSLLRKKL